MPKLFLYLDEYKMYSISSQIFEGMTEEVVQFTERASAKSEEQRGPWASGKLLADIATESQGKQERKFLYDYAYTLFEQRLIDNGSVFSVESPFQFEDRAKLASHSFVKVRGPVWFNDIVAVREMGQQLPRLQGALAYVGSGQAQEKLAAEIEQMMTTAKGAHRTELKRLLKEAKSPPAVDGLSEKYLGELTYLLEFMFGDHFEMQISLEGANSSVTQFTSVINRQQLRESAASITKKYSRHSEHPFTIFGVVTQLSRVGQWQQPQAAEEQPNATQSTGLDDTPAQGNQHMKVALRDMVAQLMNVEDTFVGRLPNEVIIDPIAVYREL